MSPRALLVLGAVATGAAAQPQAPIHAPGMEDVMRRNQEMYAPYFECTRKHEKEMQFFQAAQAVREIVDLKGRLRPDLQAKADAALPVVFQRYRALGGTAASPEAVVVPENPCPPPIRLPAERPPVMIEQRKSFTIERKTP